MKENWKVSMFHVLKDEGGYGERSSEPGGAVNKGVTFEAFKFYCKKKNLPEPTFDDLKAISVETAMEVFRGQYADLIHFDELPHGSDYCMLDSAINNGPGGSIRFLQRALELPITGKFDAVTLEKAKAMDATELVNKFCDIRLKIQKTFKNYNYPTGHKGKTYGWVWDRRVGLVRTRAMAIIAAIKAREEK